jgi:hypothetical protein
MTSVSSDIRRVEYHGTLMAQILDTVVTDAHGNLLYRDLQEPARNNLEEQAYVND